MCPLQQDSNHRLAGRFARESPEPLLHPSPEPLLHLALSLPLAPPWRAPLPRSPPGARPRGARASPARSCLVERPFSRSSPAATGACPPRRRGLSPPMLSWRSRTPLPRPASRRSPRPNRTPRCGSTGSGRGMARSGNGPTAPGSPLRQTPISRPGRWSSAETVASSSPPLPGAPWTGAPSTSGLPPRPVPRPRRRTHRRPPRRPRARRDPRKAPSPERGSRPATTSHEMPPFLARMPHEAILRAPVLGAPIAAPAPRGLPTSDVAARSPLSAPAPAPPACPPHGPCRRATHTAGRAPERRRAAPPASPGSPPPSGPLPASACSGPR